MPTRLPSRVLFYGVTGSGKSSAAHAYAKASGLPEYSADDDIGWFPGWRLRAVEEQRRLAADIASREKWVLDSAYATWRDMIFPRAELIVALDYPRWVSLSRLLRRSLYRAVSGQLVCNGNTESFRRLLTKDSIIWWHFQSFTRKHRVIQAMTTDPDLPPVIVFKHPRELNRWLSNVRNVNAA